MRKKTQFCPFVLLRIRRTKNVFPISNAEVSIFRVSEMRLAIGVEYHGANFFGWQRQKGVRTVQEELETALSKVANSTVTLICAGRTDAGVHALGQVAHFDTSVYRENFSWIQGGNSNLPRDLSISWCLRVPELFHARYLALTRTYQYVIFNRKFRSGKLFDSTTWVPRNLDEKENVRGCKFPAWGA